MDISKRLKQSIDRQVRRLDKPRRSLFAQTVYLGTLGLVMVLPVVAGAYLGLWLDSLAGGYSMRWTLSLIVLGVVIGAVNVYLLIKD
ncbi:MAG: AtpZ/AtpI family protein [Acidithiobacillus sp.]|jgi:ATP synthase protein I|uniref:AtpZ/AtpI family protein n=1 Tax=Acidithiobacillus sp. TaxID=1872118 RepID=UPI003CFCFAAF